MNTKTNDTSQATLAKLRRDAELIYSAGVNAVKGDHAIFQHCRMNNAILHVDDLSFDLEKFKRILVIGAGKATASMADAIEQLLGVRISSGIISVKYGHGRKLDRFEIIEAGHPVFDQNSIAGAEAIMSAAESAGPEDLVIFLLSGGGSALMAKPAPPITLHEKQEVIKRLLSCGADIDSINTIRKHISMVKGGRLAQAAYPATLLTLIISDVVGDRLDTIGSGPTVPDTTTYEDSLRVIKKYNLKDKLPFSVTTRLTDGAAGRLPETPRQNDPAFLNAHARIIATNGTALETAKLQAESMGYNTLVLSSMIEGDTRAAAGVLSSIAKEVKKTGNPVAAPACILSGGETTVEIKGNGRGGRNQEFALASAIALTGIENAVALCGGTDGTDGPTDAAGGIVDCETVRESLKNNIDPRSYLENNDSYNFLSQTGNLLVTGPTGTNVMDLRIFLIV